MNIFEKIDRYIFLTPFESCLFSVTTWGCWFSPSLCLMMLVSSHPHLVKVMETTGWVFFVIASLTKWALMCRWVFVSHTQVRDEELEELENLLCNFCELPATGGVENGYGKINILLQTYIGRGEVDSFSLISDLSYVAQVRHKHRKRSMHIVFILHFLKVDCTLLNQSNRNIAIKLLPSYI